MSSTYRSLAAVDVMEITDVEFRRQEASCFLSRECLVERAGRVGGQIIEDDADDRGLGEVHVGESRMQAAKSSAVRLAVTFQGRWTSRKTNRLAVPLRLYSQS
jgi:hypothetical protein